MSLPRAGGGGRVIVVDDDPSVRRAIARLLKSADYRVDTFASVCALPSGADLEDAVCLVLDVRMPGPSGLDFQATLTRAGVSVPIVLITGHGDAEMAVRAMNAGAVAFLSKPFDDEDLLRAIDQASRRPRRAPPPGWRA